jgi:hypothetical protein
MQLRLSSEIFNLLRIDAAHKMMGASRFWVDYRHATKGWNKMLRRILLLSTFLTFSVSNELANAQELPTLKKVIPTDSVQFSRVFSSDARVGAMIFDNLVVATEIGRGTLPSIHTKQFSYVLQPDSQDEVIVNQMVRGFVSTQVSGSASLLIHSGGRAVVVDWKKAIAAAKAPVDPKFTELKMTIRDKDMKAALAANKAEKFDDFFVEFRRQVPLGKPLQTTFVLLVDRLPGDDGSGAMIAIDSIDFEVMPKKPSKKD